MSTMSVTQNAVEKGKCIPYYVPGVGMVTAKIACIHEDGRVELRYTDDYGIECWNVVSRKALEGRR